MLARSLVILRRLGAQKELAFANIMLATYRGQHDLDVLSGLQESLAIYQEMDIPWGIAYCLCHLGYFYMGMGSFEEAEYYLQEALKSAKGSRITTLLLLHMRV